MTSLCSSGGSGDSGGGSSGNGGGRSSSHCGAVWCGVSGGGQMQLRWRPTLASQQDREWLYQRGTSPSPGRCPYVIPTGRRAGQTCGTPGHAQSCYFAYLSVAWHAKFGDEDEIPHWLELLRPGVDVFDLDYDAILTAMYALPGGAEGDCYLCMQYDPGIEVASLGASEAAALGASESALSGIAPAEAWHTFTLDSSASRCFFRDSTALTPLPAPVAVSLADPSGDSVLARSSTVLPCPAVPSGSLSGLHLPSFSTNLVSNAVLQDVWVDIFTPGGQRVAICTCSRTGRHLATFTCRPGSSLYTMTTESPQVAATGQVSASEAPLQTLHLDVWGPARVRGQGGERYFLLVVDDYSCYTTLFPLHTKGEVPAVLIPWTRVVRLHLRRRFRQDLPVLRVHYVRGGAFTSDLLRAFCQGEGIEQSFTLPASPQQNGAAEHRIGLVMEVGRTSLIHAAAPHFLWPFAVRYAAQQLNLWPRVSLLETSPTLRWMGEVGDASCFWVWGARTLVRDTSADKLSFCTITCVFLGFVPDAPGWQFYHPTSRHVFPSQDVTFDGSVPFYRLFPYRTAPLPPPPLFLAPSPPPVDPLPPQGPAPSGAAVGGAAGGAASGGAEPAAAESGGAELVREVLKGVEPGGAEPTSAEPRGAEPEGAESGGAGSAGVPLGLVSRRGPVSPQQAREWLASRTRLRSHVAGVACRGGAGSADVSGPGGARTGGTGAAGTGTAPGAGGVGSGGAAAGGTGAGGPGASAVDPGVGDPRAGGAGFGDDAAGGLGAGTVDSGVGDPRTGGAGSGGAATGGTRAGGSGAIGGVGAGGDAAGVTGAGGAAGVTGAGGAAVGGAGAGGFGAVGGAGATGTSGTAPPRLFFAPSSPSSLPPPDSMLCQVLSLLSSTGLPLQPGAPLPAPSPYTEHTNSFTECREPASRPGLPVHARRTGSRVPRERSPPVPSTHAMALRPSSFPQRVPLPSPPASSLPDSAAASALVSELVEFPAACRIVLLTLLSRFAAAAASLVAESESVCPLSIGGECALGTDVLEDRQENFECLVATVPPLVAMLLAPEGDPDAPDITTPRSYAEAIAGPYSSQWQIAMDAEMASWKSTGTYVDKVPPPGAIIVDGMWIFRLKRPSGFPLVFKACYVARGFRKRQGVDFF
ncbi:unnamed protein product [Closterium sp. NIES-53]